MFYLCRKAERTTEEICELFVANVIRREVETKKSRESDEKILIGAGKNSGDFRD